MPASTRRAQRIKPFQVMKLLGRARQLEAQGRAIVHMEIGEPDFATPGPIVEAVQAAIARGEVHYTPSAGLPELREAVAGYYRRRYGVSVDAGRIILTPGASGALLLALGTLLESERELLMADPGYPCNRNFARFFDARARSIPVGADSAYQLTLNHVRDNWDANSAGVLLASPSNPTGTLMDEDELKKIAAFVEDRDSSLIMDEIYHGLIYDIEANSILNLTDRAFVINSFSKYFCMTGWRLGWVVAPEGFSDTLERLSQNIFLAAPTPAQHAALAAFSDETTDILEQRRLEFKRRRDYLLDALPALGFEITVKPQGAFYIYANCSGLTDNSHDFCERLLEEAGVAITPGDDFGDYRADEHVRFAYTTSMEQLEEGVGRLGKFLKQ